MQSIRRIFLNNLVLYAVKFKKNENVTRLVGGEMKIKLIWSSGNKIIMMCLSVYTYSGNRLLRMTNRYPYS